MNDLALRIKRLYPNADFVLRVILQDDGDGEGPYIDKWDESLGPMPTEAELLAVDLTPTDDEKLDQSPPNLPAVVRALCLRAVPADWNALTAAQQQKVGAILGKVNGDTKQRLG